METNSVEQKQNFIEKHGVKKIVIFSVGATIVLLVGIVVVASILKSSFSVSSDLGQFSSKNVNYNYAGSPMEYGRSISDTSVSSPEATGSAGETGGIDRMVTKSGSLSLLIGDIDDVSREIKTISERNEGFVTYSNIYETNNGKKAGRVTIKVPSDKFDTAFDDIKKLAIKVETENSNVSDVTEQYIDLSAQLKNLRAEEEQYVQIMKTADTVEDTLKVASRLSNVRGRIERIEGQLKFLSRQVEMSTITVSLEEEAVVEEVLGIRWRPLFVVRESFKVMLGDAADYADSMIRFLFMLPMVLVWVLTLGVIVYGLWRLGKWLKSKVF